MKRFSSYEQVFRNCRWCLLGLLIGVFLLGLCLRKIPQGLYAGRFNAYNSQVCLSGIENGRYSTCFDIGHIHLMEKTARELLHIIQESEHEQLSVVFSFPQPLDGLLKVSYNINKAGLSDREQRLTALAVILDLSRREEDFQRTAYIYPTNLSGYAPPDLQSDALGALLGLSLIENGPKIFGKWGEIKCQRDEIPLIVPIKKRLEYSSLRNFSILPLAWDSQHNLFAHIHFQSDIQWFLDEADNYRAWSVESIETTFPNYLNLLSFYGWDSTVSAVFKSGSFLKKSAKEKPGQYCL